MEDQESTLFSKKETVLRNSSGCLSQTYLHLDSKTDKINPVYCKNKDVWPETVH